MIVSLPSPLQLGPPRLHNSQVAITSVTNWIQELDVWWGRVHSIQWHASGENHNKMYSSVTQSVSSASPTCLEIDPALRWAWAVSLEGRLSDTHCYWANTECDHLPGPDTGFICVLAVVTVHITVVILLSACGVFGVQARARLGCSIVRCVHCTVLSTTLSGLYTVQSVLYRPLTQQHSLSFTYHTIRASRCQAI